MVNWKSKYLKYKLKLNKLKLKGGMLPRGFLGEPSGQSEFDFSGFEEPFGEPIGESFRQPSGRFQEVHSGPSQQSNRSIQDELYQLVQSYGINVKKADFIAKMEHLFVTDNWENIKQSQAEFYTKEDYIAEFPSSSRKTHSGRSQKRDTSGQGIKPPNLPTLDFFKQQLTSGRSHKTDKTDKNDSSQYYLYKKSRVKVIHIRSNKTHATVLDNSGKQYDVEIKYLQPIPTSPTSPIGVSPPSIAPKRIGPLNTSEHHEPLDTPAPRLTKAQYNLRKQHELYERVQSFGINIKKEDFIMKIEKKFRTNDWEHISSIVESFTRENYIEELKHKESANDIRKIQNELYSKLGPNPGIEKNDFIKKFAVYDNNAELIKINGWESVNQIPPHYLKQIKDAIIELSEFPLEERHFERYAWHGSYIHQQTDNDLKDVLNYYVSTGEWSWDSLEELEPDEIINMYWYRTNYLKNIEKYKKWKPNEIVKVNTGDDVFYVLMSIISNPRTGNELSWEFLTSKGNERALINAYKRYKDMPGADGPEVEMIIPKFGDQLGDPLDRGTNPGEEVLPTWGVQQHVYVNPSDNLVKLADGTHFFISFHGGSTDIFKDRRVIEIPDYFFVYTYGAHGEVISMNFGELAETIPQYNGPHAFKMVPYSVSTGEAQNLLLTKDGQLQFQSGIKAVKIKDNMIVESHGWLDLGDLLNAGAHGRGAASRRLEVKPELLRLNPELPQRAHSDITLKEILDIIKRTNYEQPYHIHVLACLGAASLRPRIPRAIQRRVSNPKNGIDYVKFGSLMDKLISTNSSHAICPRCNGIYRQPLVQRIETGNGTYVRGTMAPDSVRIDALYGYCFCSTSDYTRVNLIDASPMPARGWVKNSKIPVRYNKGDKVRYEDDEKAYYGEILEVDLFPSPNGGYVGNYTISFPNEGTVRIRHNAPNLVPRDARKSIYRGIPDGMEQLYVDREREIAGQGREQDVELRAAAPRLGREREREIAGRGREQDVELRAAAPRRPRLEIQPSSSDREKMVGKFYLHKSSKDSQMVKVIRISATDPNIAVVEKTNGKQVTAEIKNLTPI